VSSTTVRIGILLFCTAASLLILQRAFDASDHRKAEHAVRDYTIGDRRLGALVESKSPGGVWSSGITHGCRGIVRVAYHAPVGEWAFDYDVPGHAIHPGDEAGRAALAELTGAGPSDGGALPR
jgi:hypothetical protein